jgi:hypothetical protein
MEKEEIIQKIISFNTETINSKFEDKKVTLTANRNKKKFYCSARIRLNGNICYIILEFNKSI